MLAASCHLGVSQDGPFSSLQCCALSHIEGVAALDLSSRSTSAERLHAYLVRRRVSLNRFVDGSATAASQNLNSISVPTKWTVSLGPVSLM